MCIPLKLFIEPRQLELIIHPPYPLFGRAVRVLAAIVELEYQPLLGCTDLEGFVDEPRVLVVDDIGPDLAKNVGRGVGV